MILVEKNSEASPWCKRRRYSVDSHRAVDQTEVSMADRRDARRKPAVGGKAASGNNSILRLQNRREDNITN
jgi:hypothetical protein